MNILRLLTRIASTKRLVLTLTATAAALLSLSGMAAAVTPVVVPAGGDFEQTPLVYSTTTSCGLLCSVAVSRQAEGSNHYLHSEYTSLLGLIGTNTGTARITSPQFTWTKATPSAVTLAFDRRNAIGELLGIDSGTSFTVSLADDTTASATTIDSEELTTSEATFTPISLTVPATDIADGHTYHLVLTETFHTLVGAARTASVDLDNVGLAITPAAAAPSIGTTSLGAPTEHGVAGTATVDPHGEATTYGLQYGTTIAYGAETSLQNIPVGQEGLQQVGSSIAGLLPGTTYHARFVVSSPGGTTFGPDMAFTTAASSPPSLGAASVGGITATGAIVDATVNPGLNATTVEVQYGLTNAYGQTTTTQILPGGSGPASVQIPVSGLSASTTYHARLVATNADGSQASTDLSFTTTAGGATGVPAIGPTSASGIGERAASLVTSADPHGEAATYAVEYGLGTGYGLTTAAQPIAIGSSGAQALSVPISGLAPGTTYHARYVVSSGAGTSHGLDATFTTAPTAPPAVGAAAVNTITSTGAKVETTVDPKQNVTAVEVEYGPTTAYGQTTAGQGIGAGAGATALQIPLGTLSANTTYHARVVATNADGMTESQDLTFTTPLGGTEGASGGSEPPSVTSTSVDGQGEHEATVHAVINPHGQEASYEVQYGTSTGYGSASSAQLLPLGTSGGSAVSIAVAGLQPGTTYHARFRVVTSAGTTTGSDIAFATLVVGTGTNTNNATTGGGGGSSSSGGGSTQGASTAGAGGTGVPTCLRVQAKRRGPAARLLSVPTLQQITAARPLRVTLAKAAGKRTRLRYSIGGAAYVSTSSRLVKVKPSQLGNRSSTAVRFVLRAAHRRTRSLRLVLSATPCGVVLNVKRVGSQLQVSVSRLTRSHGVVLSLPRTLGSPSRLMLLTTTKNHAYRLRSGRSGIRLAPKAAQPTVRRSSGVLSVTRLSEQVTGFTVTFPAGKTVAGSAIKARVTSAGGSVQALTASVR
jgi:hypothetical protein